MKQNFILLLILIFPFAGTTQTAVNLDGVNDFLNSTVTENITNFPTASFTLECWVKSPNAPSSSGGYSGPVYGSFMGIYWNHQNGLYAGAGAVADQNGTFFPVSFGQLLGNNWYHLAVSYDGATVRAYKNGTLVSAANTGGGLSYNPATSLMLGRHVTLNHFFGGTIDELRIWNVARSAADISSNYLLSINTPQTGLLASYTFEEGVPNGDNSALTTAQDHSGNNFHAQFTNMSLNGSTSNYVGTVSNLGPLQNGALALNGLNNTVSTPLSMSNVNFPGITMECWTKSPAAPTGGMYDGPMYTDNAAIIWNHQNAAYRGAASVQAANGTFYAASFGTLVPNTWYHLALTYDGSTLKAYKNGVLVSSTVTSGGLADNAMNFAFGKHPSQGYHFNGSIDALRIWNYTRNCFEINETINQELSSAQNGLLLSYNFNSVYPEGINSGTSVSDQSGNNRHGTLLNFTLNGPTSNYGYPAPFNSASAAPVFTAHPQNVSSCDGAPVTMQCNISSFANMNFQWQADMGSGFINLNNDANYAGVYGPVLTISAPNNGMNN